MLKIKPLIISITGKARHGKDTLANYLKQNLVSKGYKVQKLSYANAIKKLAFSKGWDGKKDNNGVAFLQFLGTEYGRDILGIDTWIQALESKINSDSDIIIISDCRYNNEVQYFTNVGYRNLVIEIIRLVDTPWYKKALNFILRRKNTPYFYNNKRSKKLNSHLSEKGLKPSLIDYTLACSNKKCIKRYAIALAESIDTQIKRGV